MNSAPFFPEFVYQHGLDDTHFYQAYESVSAGRRAWLKQCIAWLHAWHGEDRAPLRERQVTLAQGLCGVERSKPLTFAVILADADFTSPVRCLAALLPALLAGVENVLVLRVRRGRSPQPWPDALLTALELAGQELVSELSLPQIRNLLEWLGDSGHPGAVVSLSRDPLSGKGCPICLLAESRSSVRFWQPDWNGELGIWAGDSCPWDLDTLGWAHGDTQLHLWGAKGPVPGERFERRSGSFDDFLAHGYRAAFVPRDRRPAVLESVPLIMGPGLEGCWLWPGLTPGFFRSLTAAWEGRQSVPPVDEHE